MVKVWSDAFTGEEMISDGYPLEFENEGHVIKAQASIVTKKEEDGGVAHNVEEGEAAAPEEGAAPPESVVNIVDHFQLAETKFDKKTFVAYVKVFLPKVIKLIEEKKAKENEKAKPKKSEEDLKKATADYVKSFKTGVQTFIKHVVEHFDDYQFFTSKTGNDESSVCFCTYPEGKTEPVFYFLKDAMTEAAY